MFLECKNSPDIGIIVDPHPHAFFRCQLAEYTTPLKRPLSASTVDN